MAVQELFSTHRHVFVEIDRETSRHPKASTLDSKIFILTLSSPFSTASAAQHLDARFITSPVWTNCCICRRCRSHRSICLRRRWSACLSYSTSFQMIDFVHLTFRFHFAVFLESWFIVQTVRWTPTRISSSSATRPTSRSTIWRKFFTFQHF